MILFTSHLPLNFVFPSPPPKTISFLHTTKPISENEDLGFIYRWIIVKFEKQVPNSFLNILIVGNYGNMSKLREIPFAS